jgi:hypothetical protein
MSNIYDPNFNKNVVEVYTEEPGFTGFKGLEWNKLDDVENILREGVVVSGFDVNLNTTNSILSGIKNDTNSVDNKLFITGDPFPAGVQGTIVFQADLTSQFDNVDISGQAGRNINSIANNGVNITNLSAESPQVDAFSRQRVSEAYTLADYSHIYGEETELLSKTNGANSTVTFDINKAKAILTVGTGPNDFTIHQSRMYHHYMPGKSQFTLQSFNFTGYRAGTNKRVGLFDDYNGIFFLQSGDGTKAFVLRNNVSGYIYDEMVTQNNWSLDKCDGTGPSAFNLDTTKTQLFSADFQWLGVGRVRVGFVNDGVGIIAHEFLNSNYKESVYWSNPNLPVRCDIRNYDTAVGTDTMDQICATVLSEGGYSEAGVDFSAKNNSPRVVTPSGKLPMLGIGLKTGYYGKPNRSVVRANSANVFTLADAISYEFWRLPSTGSLLGGSWLSANDESVVLYNPTATGINFTSGSLIDAGFVAGGGGVTSRPTSSATQVQTLSSAKRGYISQNIDSTDSNIFVLIGTGIGTLQSNSYATIQWRETR